MASGVTGALLQNVHHDFQVVDVNRVNVPQVHVVLRRVSPLNTSDLGSLDAAEGYQVRSAVGVLAIPFSDPPVVAETIDHT